MEFQMFFFLLFLLLLFGCTNTKHNGMVVVASNSAFASIAREIVGENATVINVMPEGTDPHSFEPSAKDVKEIEDADLFIYSSLSDKWAESINSERKLDVSKTINLIKTDVGYDPHVWLSPLSAKSIAYEIYKSLSEIDPNNKEYKLNYIMFEKGINRVDGYARNRFLNCKTKKFVISHPFLNYFSRDYGIEEIAINNLDSSDASTKHIAEVIDFMNSNDIHTIVISSLEDKGHFDAIRKEADADFVTIEPLPSKNEDYLTMMINNINTLSKVMECKE